MTREEIALELEWLDVHDAFVAAKRDHPRDSDEYRAAKQAMSDMRRHWRGIRDYFAELAVAGEGDAVAATASIKATTKKGKG